MDFFRMKWHEVKLISYVSGQFIATSHDLGPQKVAQEGKSPYFKDSRRLVKYYNLATNIQHT